MLKTVPKRPELQGCNYEDLRDDRDSIGRGFGCDR